MIVVFGSINIDLVTRADRIPAPGETVLGGDYDAQPGGKGANQALAARRASARVAMVGAYGPDAFAEEALSLLRRDGVDLSASRKTVKPTGAAFIVVDPKGENAIVVAPGANAEARASQLEQVPLGPGDLLLLQHEVPIAEVEAAALYARARGAKVMLNAAPAKPISSELIRALDYLCVNENEAREIGAALDAASDEPEAIMREIERKLGIATIVTLGPKGAVGFHLGQRFAAPAPIVDVVDTTSAGDTFVGAFAAAVDRGLGFEDAIRRGLAAGSLACAKPGAQPSMPFSGEIEALVARDR
jgi:ribokinase